MPACVCLSVSVCANCVCECECECECVCVCANCLSVSVCVCVCVCADCVWEQHVGCLFTPVLHLEQAYGEAASKDARRAAVAEGV